jgi:GNAT superfamily N-acetyltransferase
LTAPRLRPAAPGEASRLREIAEAAKGYWGYDAERVRTWAASLDLSGEIWVAEVADEVVAWAALVLRNGGVCELDDLWVDPAAFGLGIGTSLFRQACERARAVGARALEWEADPNAVGFYERMGAEVVGSVTSSWGRTLPVMRVVL